MRPVTIEPTFEAWQATARSLLQEGVPPNEVEWGATQAATEEGGATGLPGGGGAPAMSAVAIPAPSVAPSLRRAAQFRVPRQFLDLARQAAGARDPSRWRALYEVLWRLVHERRDLLDDRSDPAVRRLHGLAAQGRREAERVETAEALELEAQGGGARPFVPAGADLAALVEASRRCTGCDLYRHASQTVFGRGPADARIMLVGEQPGDQEDLRGAPFVGPAGEVLDRALGEAGLSRERIYVTNAVKHFKFVERGKRRIHQTPRLPEITACRPWLEAELGLVKPETLVCLGATAARALLGPDFRLMRDRGRVFPSRHAARTLATFHPSAVLRVEDDAAQADLYRLLVGDLRLAGGSFEAPHVK